MAKTSRSAVRASLRSVPIPPYELTATVVELHKLRKSGGITYYSPDALGNDYLSGLAVTDRKIITRGAEGALQAQGLIPVVASYQQARLYF